MLIVDNARIVKERFTEYGNETSNFFEECVNSGGNRSEQLVVYNEEKMQEVCTCG